MPFTSVQTKMLLLNHLRKASYVENNCRFNIMSFVKKEDEAKQVIKKSIVQTYAITMRWKSKQLRLDLRNKKEIVKKAKAQGIPTDNTTLAEDIKNIRVKGKQVKTTMTHHMKSPTTLFLKFPKMRYTSHNNRLIYPIGWYAYEPFMINIDDMEEEGERSCGGLFFLTLGEDIMNTFEDGYWRPNYHTDQDIQNTDEDDWLDERFCEFGEDSDEDDEDFY